MCSWFSNQTVLDPKVLSLCTMKLFSRPSLELEDCKSIVSSQYNVVKQTTGSLTIPGRFEEHSCVALVDLNNLRAAYTKVSGKSNFSSGLP